MNGLLLCFYVLSGRLYDEIVITHNNEVLGVFKGHESFKAHALQYGALYLYDASYEVDLEKKLLPDNIRYTYQTLSVVLWGIRIKEESGNVKRINSKVKDLMELVEKKKKE